jgi:hypothetical protein
VAAGDLFDGQPISYAADDGFPFPGWAPPAIGEAEARDRYDDGERFGVLAGEPSDPVAALVVDRRNAKVIVTRAEPRHQLVLTGEAELRLTAATWLDGHSDGTAVELVAERASKDLLRLRRRPAGGFVWVDELLARLPAAEDESPQPWPEFGDWGGLARIERAQGTQWWDDGGLELVDADGWLLDELAEHDVPARWRDLARRYDAPRAYGQPPEVQAKLAEPRGWRPQGRRWRRTAEVRDTTLITDVSFVAGAGGGSDVILTVARGPLEVTVPLPAATGRVEARSGGIPGSPAQPRPSASAQVGVTAVLDLAGEVHDVVLQAISDGAVPDGWARLVG